MSSAQLASTSISAAPGRVERAAVWHKNGTIERIMRDRGAFTGERLHPMEKMVAVLLLGYASSSDRNPRCFRSEADLVDDLGCDRKTFAKYVATLVRRGLVITKRDRPDGAMTYYLAPLVAAFSEAGPGVATVRAEISSLDARRTEADARTGKDSRTSTESDDSSVRETAPADRESFPDGSGNAPGADRESFPVPLELVSGTRTERPNELQALARRFGVDVNLFEHRPERVAAAATIVRHCDRWNITPRRLRALTKQHGFTAVAGAVGYVLAQVELSAARSATTTPSERSGSRERPVHNPAALFEAAMKRGWCDRLPGLADDPYLPDRRTTDPDESLWAALSNEVRLRVSSATYEGVWRSARLVARSGDRFIVEVGSAFAAGIVRTQVAPVAAAALRKLGFEDLILEVTVAGEATS